jgi:hypothetical protein
MLIEGLINAVSIFCCFFLAFHGIKQWLEAKFNHEDMFFWGIAFLLLGIVYMINIFDLFVHLRGLNYVVHILHTFVFVFWMHAVLLNVIGCDGKHQSCRVCKKKLVRLGMWILILPIVVAIPLIAFNSDIDVNAALGMYGLQYLGAKTLHIVIEALHGGIALILFIIIPHGTRMTYLKIAFLIASISEFIQIANIHFYDFNNMGLFQFESSLKMISLLLMFVALKKVLKKD